MTLYAAIGLSLASIAVAFLNGDCGPGLKRPAALRKALEAPPMPDDDEDDAKSQAQLRSVLIELREVKSMLQSMRGGGNSSSGAAAAEPPSQPFGRMLMPPWALGEPAAPPAAALGRGSGGRGAPTAAMSTANMQPCILPWAQPQPPPPAGRDRNDRNDRKDRNDRNDRNDRRQKGRKT
jgi:hypothetical protein